MSYISKNYELQPGEEDPNMDTVTVKSNDQCKPIEPLYKKEKTLAFNVKPDNIITT